MIDKEDIEEDELLEVEKLAISRKGVENGVYWLVSQWSGIIIKKFNNLFKSIKKSPLVEDPETAYLSAYSALRVRGWEAYVRARDKNFKQNEMFYDAVEWLKDNDDFPSECDSYLTDRYDISDSDAVKVRNRAQKYINTGDSDHELLKDRGVLDELNDILGAN